MPHGEDLLLEAMGALAGAIVDPVVWVGVLACALAGAGASVLRLAAGLAGALTSWLGSRAAASPEAVLAAGVAGLAGGLVAAEMWLQGILPGLRLARTCTGHLLALLRRRR